MRQATSAFNIKITSVALDYLSMPFSFPKDVSTTVEVSQSAFQGHTCRCQWKGVWDQVYNFFELEARKPAMLLEQEEDAMRWKFSLSSCLEMQFNRVGPLLVD